MLKNNNPKISIVTVVKNNVNTIEKCIKSVLNQKYKNIEYIVIDSNSEDGTGDIINKFKDKISVTIREEDAGIWDAMNKGVKLATGEIIGFLNADDFYYENALEIVQKYFSKEDIDFLFTSVEKYKLMHGFNPKKIKWSFGFYTSHSIGFYIKTDKHREVGDYNSKYLSADLDFFYKMIVKHRFVGMSSSKSEITGKFGKGGFSSRINYISHLKDLNNIRLDNGQNKIFVSLLFLFKIVKKPIKFLKAYINNIKY
tara:strand:- start:3250 stop:4014 length:765 start_codon:yes stop_codon:yes gene_type:complete